MRPLKHTVYHYTSGAAAANILDQGKIRATNILYMDDGREMQHTIDYFRRAKALRLEQRSGQISVELDEAVTRYLAQAGNTVPPDIWIATFTTARDSADQWGLAPARGHGAALGFSAHGLSRAAEGSGVLLAPCCYDDAAKIAIMSHGLEVLERLYERRLRNNPRGAPDAEPLVRYVVRELALFGALMKRSELAHEHEWRLILCNPSQTAAGARRITALPKEDYTALYIDIDLVDAAERLPIAEILVGPSPMQQMTARAFRTLLYKHGYEHVDVTSSRAGTDR
jgi:hypothetical protein